jgi:hypothetical protein
MPVSSVLPDLPCHEKVTLATYAPGFNLALQLGLSRNVLRDGRASGSHSFVTVSEANELVSGTI